MESSSVGVLVLFVILGVLTGVFAGQVADSKGHSFGAWFAAGFFFSVVGLLAAVGLGDKRVQGMLEQLVKK